MGGRGIEIEKPERAVEAVVVVPEVVAPDICSGMSRSSGDSCSDLKNFYLNSYWPCAPSGCT